MKRTYLFLIILFNVLIWTDFPLLAHNSLLKTGAAESEKMTCITSDYIFVKNEMWTINVMNRQTGDFIISVYPCNTLYLYENYLFYEECKKNGNWICIDLTTGEKKVFDFWIDKIFVSEHKCIGLAYDHGPYGSSEEFFIDLITNKVCDCSSEDLLSPLVFK